MFVLTNEKNTFQSSTYRICTVRNIRPSCLRLSPTRIPSGRYRTTTVGQRIVSSHNVRFSSPRCTCTRCTYRRTKCRRRNDRRNRTVRSGARLYTRCCWTLVRRDMCTFRSAGFCNAFLRTSTTYSYRRSLRNRTHTSCTPALKAMRTQTQRVLFCFRFYAHIGTLTCDRSTWRVYLSDKNTDTGSVISSPNTRRTTDIRGRTLLTSDKRILRGPGTVSNDIFSSTSSRRPSRGIDQIFSSPSTWDKGRRPGLERNTCLSFRSRRLRRFRIVRILKQVYHIMQSRVLRAIACQLNYRFRWFSSFSQTRRRQRECVRREQPCRP